MIEINPQYLSAAMFDTKSPAKGNVQQWCMFESPVKQNESLAANYL